MKELTLHRAGEPMPALKYHLLPPLPDRTPGNAAPRYTRLALLMVEQGPPGNAMDEVGRLLDLPLAELPLDRANSIVRKFGFLLEEVAVAARFESCEWDLPLEQGYTMLLPGLQHYRSLARVIALKARVEVAQGSYDDALQTLQTGLSMARHVAQAPTLIHGLVGIAMANIMLAPVEDLIQAPDAPNLYWALTMLPRPVVDLDRAMETEANMLTAIQFPVLRDPANANLTAEQWRELAEEIMSVADDDRLAPTALALATYPEAKRHLIDQGRAPEQVEAMPVLQVVAIYLVDGYVRLRDEFFKWYFVPYSQAREGFTEAAAQLAEAANDKDAVLAQILLPALDKACFQTVKLDRRIAALRCVEAVRLHAASHGGRLPRALADVTGVPIPDDPVQGAPFTYELTDGRAVLSALLHRHDNRKKALRYELTIEP